MLPVDTLSNLLRKAAVEVRNYLLAAHFPDGLYIFPHSLSFTCRFTRAWKIEVAVFDTLFLPNQIAHTAKKEIAMFHIYNIYSEKGYSPAPSYI